MKVYNDHLYGVRLSKEEIEKDRINKQSLSNMIDIVLCNAITNEEDFDYDLYETICEDEREYVYSLTDEELVSECENYDVDISEYDVNNESDREKIQDELMDELTDGNFSTQFYQYFIVSEDGRDIIKKFFPRETVVYYERLGIYVWCIGHWGMSWSMFYSDKKISEV